MRQIGTIAVCIVAIAGASSVAAAQAAAGWILWEKNFRVKGIAETTEWEPLDGFDTLGECRATAREQFQFALAYMKSGAGTLMGPVRPDGRSATFVLTGTGEKQTVDIRYLCFPGTFDPRPARP